MSTPFPHTVVDESVSAAERYYTLLRIVRLGPHTVRVRVHREVELEPCFAAAEVLSCDMTWTPLVMHHPECWFDRTATPFKHVNVKTELEPLADDLMRRVTAILVKSITLPEHVLDVVGALLAVAYGSTGEHVITPDDVRWAKASGGPFRAIDRPDGSVLFTKAHRHDCPLLTSECEIPCDGRCQAVQAGAGDPAMT
ncbi:hypothetical protein SAMN04488000_12678 [Lentzea albida]|uniref:Uncharacterized protein n=1 Tax=Lentzea albida TaxID=65499 RepID=A0A1H9X117_9PSEU|nr:hypothetical protein SAMN04488000_12678 [Lentzea albida]